MRTIYLDMCCFNRPYDDQTQTRIRLETQAKLELQDHVKAGSCHLLWSAALDYECSRNPYPDNQLAITQWRWLAKKIIEAGPEVVALAKPMLENGIKSYDALHVASAIAGGIVGSGASLRPLMGAVGADVVLAIGVGVFLAALRAGGKGVGHGESGANGAAMCRRARVRVTLDCRPLRSALSAPHGGGFAMHEKNGLCSLAGKRW